MGVFGYDLSDPGLYDNGFPHRIFTGIRRDCPVTWHYPPDNTPEVGGFWSIASYAATLAALELCDAVPTHADTLVDDAVALATLELAHRGDLWWALRAGSVDLGRAATELARWTSPTSAVILRAPRDLRVDGHEITEGEQLVCWLASANRDQQIFGPDAMELRLDRSPNPHLAFLAADDAAAAFESRLAELIEHTEAFVVTGEPEWERSMIRSAVRLLPVKRIPLG